MNVVAHEDDDLLFMNPDVLHDIQSGRCVRTVYLTAGDAGHGRFYWLNRQLGSEAAYSTMLDSHVIWDQQTVELAPGEYITVASPHGNNRISLVFFNLPDGGMHGEGFEASGYGNLERLSDGSIDALPAVDGQSSYSSQQLVDALSMLMSTYQPAAIRTQADVPSDSYPDHSDHVTTGHYALAAANQYNQQHFGGALSVPLTRYIGYPIHGYASNISGLDLTQKEAAFLAYAQYDGSVCQSLAQCTRTPTYGAYVSRQYTQE
jgi:LmbE family N-acetylglucosaminyl deacetylase